MANHSDSQSCFSTCRSPKSPNSLKSCIIWPLPTFPDPSPHLSSCSLNSSCLGNSLSAFCCGFLCPELSATSVTSPPSPKYGQCLFLLLFHPKCHRCRNAFPAPPLPPRLGWNLSQFTPIVLCTPLNQLSGLSLITVRGCGLTNWLSSGDPRNYGPGRN